MIKVKWYNRIYSVPDCLKDYVLQHKKVEVVETEEEGLQFFRLFDSNCKPVNLSLSDKPLLFEMGKLLEDKEGDYTFYACPVKGHTDCKVVSYRNEYFFDLTLKKCLKKRELEAFFIYGSEKKVVMPESVDLFWRGFELWIRIKLENGKIFELPFEVFAGTLQEANKKALTTQGLALTEYFKTEDAWRRFQELVSQIGELEKKLASMEFPPEMLSKFRRVFQGRLAQTKIFIIHEYEDTDIAHEFNLSNTLFFLTDGIHISVPVTNLISYAQKKVRFGDDAWSIFKNSVLAKRLMEKLGFKEDISKSPHFTGWLVWKIPINKLYEDKPLKLDNLQPVLDYLEKREISINGKEDLKHKVLILLRDDEEFKNLLIKLTGKHIPASIIDPLFQQFMKALEREIYGQESA